MVESVKIPRRSHLVAIGLFAACGPADPGGGPASTTSPAAPGGSVAAPAPSAPAPELDTHGRRNAGRKAPPECRDHGDAPSSPPTPLFDADDTRAQGTDVSDAQGAVPWKALHEGGVEFVYIRASEGHTIQDHHFEANWAMARACGLPRGAYHVYEPTQEVGAQVDNFLGRIGEDHGELPAVLDIEITPEMVASRNERNKTNDAFPSRVDYITGVLAWLTKVEAATGKRPVIYIQPWYWHSYLGKSADLVEHPLWAAGAAPRGRDGWTWSFWQHGQPAQWDSRTWDRDLFHGTKAELDALLAGLAAPGGK